MASPRNFVEISLDSDPPRLDDVVVITSLQGRAWMGIQAWCVEVHRLSSPGCLQHHHPQKSLPSSEELEGGEPKLRRRS